MHNIYHLHLACFCCPLLPMNVDTGLRVRRWLNRPIRAWKVWLQFGQGMLQASSAPLVMLVFLACHFCSADNLQLLSYIFGPLKMEECHCGLSRVFCSQESQLISNALLSLCSLLLKMECCYKNTA